MKAVTCGLDETDDHAKAIAETNMYVGAANRAPAARTPRRCRAPAPRSPPARSALSRG